MTYWLWSTHNDRQLRTQFLFTTKYFFFFQKNVLSFTYSHTSHHHHRRGPLIDETNCNQRWNASCPHFLLNIQYEKKRICILDIFLFNFFLKKKDWIRRAANGAIFINRIFTSNWASMIEIKSKTLFFSFLCSFLLLFYQFWVYLCT